MDRKKVKYEDVLRAILEDSDASSSDIESSADDNDDDDDDEGDSLTASSVADAAVLPSGSTGQSSHSRAAEDAAADDSSDSDADGVWSCPEFVWQPARNDLPCIYPFTGNTGMNVDVTGFSVSDFYNL